MCVCLCVYYAGTCSFAPQVRLRVMLVMGTSTVLWFWTPVIRMRLREFTTSLRDWLGKPLFPLDPLNRFIPPPLHPLPQLHLRLSSGLTSRFDIMQPQFILVSPQRTFSVAFVSELNPPAIVSSTTVPSLIRRAMPPTSSPFSNFLPHPLLTFLSLSVSPPLPLQESAGPEWDLYWRTRGGAGEESPAEGGDGTPGHRGHAGPQGHPGPQEPHEPWEGALDGHPSQH